MLQFISDLRLYLPVLFNFRTKLHFVLLVMLHGYLLMNITQFSSYPLDRTHIKFEHPLVLLEDGEWEN
jgi:uncharacterized protein involved in cysteine biosynthesis